MEVTRGPGRDAAPRAVEAALTFARTAARDLLDAIVDRRCPGCAGPVGRDEEVCAACDAAIDRAGSVLCLACLRGDPPATAPVPAISPMPAAPGARPGEPARAGCPSHGSGRLLLAGPPHAAPLDSVIREFKYAGGSRLAPWIASLVPEPPGIEGALGRESLLVPVPLHAARRASRGYDQAALLADALGRWWGVPVIQALRRVRETEPQARRGGGARRLNLEGAFRLDPRAGHVVRGRVLLLLDDVATTGATLLESAEALSFAGPAWILSLAAAHGGGGGGAQSPSQAEVAGLPGGVLQSRAWQIGRGAP